MTGADDDLSESSDEEDDADGGSAPRPLSPPLNLAAAPDDDSEGELEVCIAVAPADERPTATAPPPQSQSQQAAMEAYLAAMEAKAGGGAGLSLVSAMESSVNAVISSEPEYRAGDPPPSDSGRAVDAFGAPSVEETVDVVGIDAEPGARYTVT